MLNNEAEWNYVLAVYRLWGIPGPRVRRWDRTGLCASRSEGEGLYMEMELMYQCPQLDYNATQPFLPSTVWDCNAVLGHR